MADLDFIRAAFASLGAEVREPQPGLLEISLPPGAATFFDDRAQLALTLDRELHKISERDLELVVPGSPIFRSILGALGGAGAATSVEFSEAPDPGKAREAARGGLTLRGGTVTPGTPEVEPFSGTAVLFVLRVEGPEREDALVAAFVPRTGDAFEVPADGVAAMAKAGKPAGMPAVTPGERSRIREAAAAVAQREGDRRGQAAEKRSAGRMAKEAQQVRTYFESLAAELKEQKSESRGEESKKEAATRLRNLERERELRLIELQDRFRATAHVDSVAAVVISGSAARVKVVFQAGTRKLERETLWFPPVGRATPPACDLCGGAFLGAVSGVLEAAICGDPAHDVLLCAACRRHCQSCGAGLCPEHTRACACGAIACPAHGAACEACAQFCCAGHSFKCVRCCRSFCRQHSFECGVCKLISCSDHARRCGSCDIELCGEHQRPCDATGKVGCPQHMKACDECAELVLDTALQMGKCPSCRNLVPVQPGDPAVAAAEVFVPEAKGAGWQKSETKTRVRLEGRTFMNKYRVWLAKDLKPISAMGGSKLFGMRKIR